MKDIFAVKILKKKLDGFRSVKQLVEDVTSDSLYLYDSDSFAGKELNFKYYSELGSIYKLWVEADIKRLEDVFDIIVSGASIVVLSENSNLFNRIAEIFKYTDNVAVKMQNEYMLQKFIELGGKYVVADSSFEYNGVDVVHPTYINHGEFKDAGSD